VPELRPKLSASLRCKITALVDVGEFLQWTWCRQFEHRRREEYGRNAVCHAWGKLQVAGGVLEENFEDIAGLLIDTIHTTMTSKPMNDKFSDTRWC